MERAFVGDFEHALPLLAGQVAGDGDAAPKVVLGLPSTVTLAWSRATLICVTARFFLSAYMRSVMAVQVPRLVMKNRRV